MIFRHLSTLHGVGVVHVGPEIKDRELLGRIGRGDARAFATLFDRHAASVYRYAARMMRDDDAAQDVTQSVFEVLWRRRRELDVRGDSVLPWLLVTARNASLAAARRRQREPPGGLDADGLAPERDPLDLLLTSEHRDELTSALASLSETDRRIIAMCLRDGRTYESAAAELGLTVRAVTQRVYRARRHLQAHPAIAHERENR